MRKLCTLLLMMMIASSFVLLAPPSTQAIEENRIFTFWPQTQPAFQDIGEEWWTRNRTFIMNAIDPFFEIDNTSSFGALDQRNLHVIRARSLPEIPQLHLQFYNTALTPGNFFQANVVNDPANYGMYEIIVHFDPHYTDFYELFNVLRSPDQYGDPDILQPHYAVWYEVYEDPERPNRDLIYDDWLVDSTPGTFSQPVRIILSRDNEQGHSYITLKYIHMENWHQAMENLGIEEELQQRFQTETRQQDIQQRF